MLPKRGLSKVDRRNGSSPSDDTNQPSRTSSTHCLWPGSLRAATSRRLASVTSEVEARPFVDEEDVAQGIDLVDETWDLAVSWKRLERLLLPQRLARVGHVCRGGGAGEKRRGE